MAAFQPQAFGKYFLVDKIATGGMAEIFKAKTYSHGGFENLLVIKRILPHIGENEDFIEMFIDEAKVSVALQHPNIVRIYDFGKILENYFIAMECIEGKDTRGILRKLARRRQYAPPEYCAYVAHETCKGLAYAHAKTDLQGNPYGIVHRDISPSNVLVSYEGEVKVADFGIAKAESNAYQTRDGVLKGKFEYMSPEQATGKEIDARSDIFAVGIILYETLTGRRLFKTESEIATLKKIRDCDFEPPSRLNPGVPEELEKITMKALARYPEDRYQTAKEMLEALQKFLFPKTADQLRHEMADFMQEIFAEEIAEERTRLETNSEVAAKLKEEAPDNWDQAASTMGKGTAVTSTRAMVGYGIGMILVMLGISGATLALVAWYVSTTLVPETPTTGDLTVMVLPKAQIYVDGELRGDQANLDLREIDPGEHKVRLELDGYESYETKTYVQPGKTTQVSHTMVKQKEFEAPKPDPDATPDPDPEPAPRPRAARNGTLTVTIQGGGWANVFVDGNKLKQTAPFKDVSIPRGSHTIKVENAALGLSYTETVNVGGGQSVKINAKP